MEVKRKSVTKNPLSGGTGPSGAGAAAAAPAQQAMGRGGGQQLPAPADFSNRVPPVDRDQMVMLVRRTGGSSSPASRGVLLLSLSSPPGDLQDAPRPQRGGALRGDPAARLKGQAGPPPPYND